MGTWRAHRFFLSFTADRRGSSSLGIEYTMDGGELREDVEYEWEFADDEGTLLATVVAVRRAVAYAPPKPPQGVADDDEFGPGVGDQYAFRFCFTDMLRVEEIDVARPGRSFGFDHVCGHNPDPDARWLCGA